MGHDSSKFRITESVFRFGADVRAGDDAREAQLRMIRDGEAMPVENHLQLNDEHEENQPDSGGGRVMIERGKFRSLTLINWNGFFARTFDLDELVTTLSGGNGAGKSTTMAAFVTALIPDLTLLHFRVTPLKGRHERLS